MTRVAPFGWNIPRIRLRRFPRAAPRFFFLSGLCSEGFCPAYDYAARDPCWRKTDSGRIDLQWFASAEDEGRTETPSEHKLRKAREEGRVAKSAEISGSLVLLIPVLTLAFSARHMLDTFMEMTRFYLLRATDGNITDPAVIRAFLRYFVILVAPVTVAAVVAAVASNVIQTRGFMFSMKPLSPQFNKIVPNVGRFFKRALFSAEGVFNLVKSLVKITVLAVVCYMSIRSELPKLIMMIEGGLFMSVSYIASLVFKLLLVSALFFLAISIPDYLFQRRQFMESLKMSKQEVKEEYKELEGDPLVKGRMKQRMRELLNRNMILNVPKADVVITNPTHYAVALQYDRATMSAPMVIAKGQDNMAMRIKEIAREHDIPVMENKPLARALFSQVEVGDMIPPEYFQAMAVVFSKVFAMAAEKKAAVFAEEM